MVTSAGGPLERPPWQQRFHAVRHSLPLWARDAPHRAAYTTNVSGVRQLWSWDLRSDRHLALTDEPTGVGWGVPTPDGHGVVWFDEEARALLSVHAGIGIEADRVARSIYAL